MSDAAHQCFTAQATSYLRNLDREDLRSECIAIHYQKPPEDLGGGRTAIGLNFPLLIVSLYAKDGREVADRVARILNEHWDEAPPQPTPPSQEIPQ